MFCSILYCKLVYFVYLWLVPCPAVFMTYLWIHGMYVCRDAPIMYICKGHILPCFDENSYQWEMFHI